MYPSGSRSSQDTFRSAVGECSGYTAAPDEMRVNVSVNSIEETPTNSERQSASDSDGGLDVGLACVV